MLNESPDNVLEIITRWNYVSPDPESMFLRVEDVKFILRNLFSPKVETNGLYFRDPELCYTGKIYIIKQGESRYENGQRYYRIIQSPNPLNSIGRNVFSNELFRYIMNHGK